MHSARGLLSPAALLGLALSLALCCACFPGGSGGGSSHDDDSDDDDDDSADDDADDDSDDDSDNDDDDDDDQPPDAWGGVTVSEGHASSNYQALDYYCYASAAFYDPDQWEGWGDPDEESGDCELYYVSGGGGDQSDFLNAGRVTVSGADVSPIYLDPEPYLGGWLYRSNVDFNAVSDLFDPGDRIRAQINGGSGIDAQDLSAGAPGMISLTQPSNFDSLSTLPKTDTTFTWKAGDADEVALTISTYNNTTGVVIQCRAPDSQGRIDVDGGLMEHLYSSPQSLSATVSRYNTVYGSGDRPASLSALTYRQRSYIRID